MNTLRRHLPFALLATLVLSVFTTIGFQFGAPVAVGSFLAANAFSWCILNPSPHLLGVNSLGTLVGAHIIQRALELTFVRFPSLSAFSMGFRELDGSVQGASLGQEVLSRIKGTSTVSNFGTAPSDFALTDVPGKLRNFRQVYHKFTAAECNSTNLRLVDQTAEPMAVALAQEIVRSMAGMVSRSNFGVTVNAQAPFLEVAAAWTYANTLIPLITSLDLRGVNPNGRFFLANAAVNGALLADPVLVSALNSPWNAEAVRTGKMASIVAGLQYDKFPGLAPTDDTLLGFAGTRDALLYISRAPMTPDEAFAGAAARAPFNYGIIIEPNSGFAVMVQQWIETDLSIHTRLVWLDGYSIGNNRNLVRLVSAGATGAAGTVVSIAVENPGYGYRNGAGVVTAPDVTFSAGAATATAVIDAVGAVTAINVTAPGAAYAAVPSVIITPVAGGRCDGPATAAATVGGLK